MKYWRPWKLSRSRQVHVYPTSEENDHVCEELKCPCEPRRDAEDPRVVIHRRFA